MPTMRLVLLVVFTLMMSASVSAQEPSSAAETLEKLKLELIDVQAKEEYLRNRAQQLDYDLKPENVERALAGIGSTKPEELREQRRRQLTIEREGVMAQLQTVELQRTRLESAIAVAESRAYQESASQPPQSSSLMLRPSLLTSSPGRFILGGLLLTAAITALFFFFRKSTPK